ncbi:type II toxin-antitoxin system HicB family antitoxin [Desulfonatronum thioautotrophicum]|uniref:type II toxin-antitoxin system HicB family antitoxin n=1 Tax=Desulfonatronum thioautotrophicum TaxID=617001 RepID=UPI0005EB9313|nr:type II toxin-antitoxin system HicB family antitoxin [Desulfonatronum thioautotrophicum]
MNKMSYKNYTARIDFDERDNILVGRVLGIQDIVSFHAENVADLRTAFEEAVDDYLEACAALGKQPEKSPSGQLMLRIPKEVHGAALIASQAAGKSLNQWAAEALEKHAHES